VRPRVLFLVEQTLGHKAHSMNLERLLAASPDIEPILIKIPFSAAERMQRLPGLGNWSARASWTARREIQRQLALAPVDAMFIHTQVASLLATDLMRAIPTVVSLDATPLNFDAEGAHYGHRRQSGGAEWVKLLINRRALASASAVVAWCAWTAESLIADYLVDPDKVHVIHPGVDIRLFRPVAHGLSARARILFVGGDFERKGGRDLLAALDGMLDEVEVDLVTAGDPLVPANVRVHHLTPQSIGLRRLYSEADIFVLPSRADCFPQAVAEALAAGLPVIATAVGGVGEMVREGFNGRLVPRGSVPDLAEALHELVRDPGRRRRMGRESLRLALGEHDAMINNQRIVDLVWSLASAARGRRIA
jgi:glycosyltransferase involved in cell wall biosynthesis